MATISPRVGFTLAGDGGAGEGGDDLVDVTAHISNNYSLIDKLLGIVRFTTAAGKPTTNNYEGKIAQEIDNGNLFIYDGAQWQILPGSTFTCTSGTRPTSPYTVYQGLRIWETDTKAYGFYDGTTWVMWDTQWQTYAPGWWSSATQPSIGNGSITGKYLRSGRECSVHMALIAGSTTTYGSGQYYLSIPSAMSSPHSSNVTLGTAWAINQGNYYMTGVVNMQGTMVSVFLPASLTNTNSGQWGATSPWAFKNTDQMSVFFRYPMA